MKELWKTIKNCLRYVILKLVTMAAINRTYQEAENLNADTSKNDGTSILCAVFIKLIVEMKKGLKQKQDRKPLEVDNDQFNGKVNLKQNF